MRRRSVVGIVLSLSLAWGLVGSYAPPLPPGFFSVFHWYGDDPQFGGFSAIRVSADGSGFVTISDRGGYTSGRFIRDDQDRIDDIVADPVRLLNGPDNLPLVGNLADSEGLALLPDGQVYVSFERIARVVQYAKIDRPGVILPRPQAFKDMSRNASLESLVFDARGVLYTLPEATSELTAPFPVYRYKNGIWDQPFMIPRRGWFLAVDADIGPDGKFYLLERQFKGFSGFATRVRRFTMGPNGLFDEQILFKSAVGQHDNLEGLSVWRDTMGTLRLTMISDDNFFFLQRTEIVEYRVPD